MADADMETARDLLRLVRHFKTQQSLAAKGIHCPGGRYAVTEFDAEVAIAAALRAARAEERESGAYLIWSNEHGAWWRPNSCGYTTYAKAAGIYSFEEAQKISWSTRDGWKNDGVLPKEIMVPIEGIPEEFRPIRNPTGGEPNG